MKRKILITVFSLIVTTVVICQAYVPFHTDSAKWSNLSIHGDPTVRIDTTLERLYLKGDSVYNNHTYHNMWSQTGSIDSPTTNYFGGIREVNKKIYYIGLQAFNPDQEILLYDFTKHVGDTIYHTFQGGSFDGYSVVVAIDSISISGQYRKRFKINERFNSPNEYDYWVEGIGNIENGLLKHIMPIPTCACKNINKFICYSENDALIYKSANFDNCVPSYFWTSINAIRPSTLKVLLKSNSELFIESTTIPDMIAVQEDRKSVV